MTQHQQPFLAGLAELAGYAKRVFDARNAHSFDICADVLNRTADAGAELLETDDVRFTATVVVPGFWRGATRYAGTARIDAGGNRHTGITFAIIRLLEDMGVEVELVLMQTEVPSR